jgi:hypothetical protein
MNTQSIKGLLTSLGFTAASFLVQGAGLEYSKDGVCGYKDTPMQPWSGYHTHDPDRPVPAKVAPGEFGTQAKAGSAPGDALVLFDGKNLEQWKALPGWKVENGELVSGNGLLTTQQEFGDCQLHLEWQAPNPPQGEMFNQGNNGVLMMGLTEIQIFDSWTNKLYADGQAASVYAQTPPLVNACRPPGEWQTYDIVWIVPVFENGKLIKPARVTMFHNGLLVHHFQEVYGDTPHRGLASYKSPITKGPVSLMGHNSPVRFRNIWIRPLPPRKDIKAS